jgi:hypothetical protein
MYGIYDARNDAYRMVQWDPAEGLHPIVPSYDYLEHGTSFTGPFAESEIIIRLRDWRWVKMGEIGEGDKKALRAVNAAIDILNEKVMPYLSDWQDKRHLMWLRPGQGYPKGLSRDEPNWEDLNGKARYLTEALRSVGVFRVTMETGVRFCLLPQLGLYVDAASTET